MATQLALIGTTASGMPSPVVLDAIHQYPRLRYMGSKYKLVPDLLEIFGQLDFATALDAFSGSGVVAYALKQLGKSVTANDFLHFPATVAKATVENAQDTLSAEDIALITGPPRDHRDFIFRTFEGLYFPDSDHQFLDSAWSHIDHLPVYKQDIAIAALCLAAARKQPRGVFTITDFRYDDGRKNLRMPLRDQFMLTAEAFNNVVYDGGTACNAQCQDVFEIDHEPYDLVYLDPPYAPLRDDNCYIKRYHFLEGLSVYWRGQEIMTDTATKKLRKRYTPFSYKRSVEMALLDMFHHFHNSTIVLSYSSNAYPSADRIVELLKSVKNQVIVHELDHRYSFGTHSGANRRSVTEYVFVAS